MFILLPLRPLLVLLVCLLGLPLVLSSASSSSSSSADRSPVARFADERFDQKRSCTIRDHVQNGLVPSCGLQGGYTLREPTCGDTSLIRACFHVSVPLACTSPRDCRTLAELRSVPSTTNAQEQSDFTLIFTFLPICTDIESDMLAFQTAGIR